MQVPGVQRAAIADRLLSTARVLATGNRGSLVLLRSGLNVFGAGWFVYVLATSRAIIGFDTISYWLVDPSDLYRWTDSSTVAGPFRYSPVLGQLIDPLGILSWPAFQALFLALTLGTLMVLGGRWALALLLIPSVLGEVYLGNIDLFIAVSMDSEPELTKKMRFKSPGVCSATRHGQAAAGPFPAQRSAPRRRTRVRCRQCCGARRRGSVRRAPGGR